MSDDPIERIRLHIEKHKAKVQAPFSIAGLTALLEELDRWKAHAIGLEHKVSTQARQFEEFVERDADDVIEFRRQRDELRFQIEHLEACVTIHDRNRKELKAQVEQIKNTNQQQYDTGYAHGRAASDSIRDTLKAQVDRLLAKEGERIDKELRRIERYE